MTNAWYPHYTGDYGRDTADLSLMQHGAYRLLLDHYYSTSVPLPSEKAAIYRICRAFEDAERAAVDLVVARFFRQEADGYHNKRADTEILKRAEHHDRLSEASRKGNAKRWGKATPQGIPQGIPQAVASPQPQPQPQPQEKKNPAAKPAPPPSDPRHRPFIDAFTRLYKERYNQSPTLTGRDFSRLKDFLECNPGVTQDDFERRYCYFRKSTDRIYKPRHGSLSFFLEHFNEFVNGPILERNGSNEASNRAEQRTDRNLRAAGLL